MTGLFVLLLPCWMGVIPDKPGKTEGIFIYSIVAVHLIHLY